MPDDFKPCDALAPGDLERYPIWSFDTDREGIEGTDETWVGPIELSFVPDDMAELFVKAAFRDAIGADSIGALLVAFRNYKPVVTGLALLVPRYCALSIREGRITPPLGLELPPELAATLPLRYSAMLRAGTRDFVLEGSAAL